MIGIEDPALFAVELAEKYGRHPNEFLRAPISELMRHVARAHRLQEMTRKARGED